MATTAPMPASNLVPECNDRRNSAVNGIGRVRSLRAIGTAVIGPIRFAHTTGYWRSAMAGKAVDTNGHPLPWYCIPAIEFLDIMDFSLADVLEFGSGQSTLWWARKARSVVAVEDSEAWHGYVRAEVAQLGNVRVEFEADLGAHARYPLTLGRRFDVVVIDGGDRANCARTSLQVLAPGGLLIVDNSEGSWGAPGTYPILEMFDAAGMMRVDFNGYAPGVLTTSVTSLFFEPNCAWLRHLGPPKTGHR